jgi:anaerobic magnesium-protoporphyrin IX monomethyl ester cyclase
MKETSNLKTLFVIPPAMDKKRIPERLFGCSYTVYPMPNLAVLYAAAVLRESGVAVELFDGSKLREEDFYRQLPDAEFYVFHSVLLSAPADIKAAKRISKKRKVIFFGPHPTYAPKDFLINENCLVARGEADLLIRGMVKAKDPKKLKGVSYLKGKKVINNQTAGNIEDLDKLSFPARDLDKNEYRSLKLRDSKFTVVLASRQCSYRCYYCVPNSISWARELEWKNWANKKGKPPVRVRSAKNVIVEVTLLAKQGYREISFIDDQFVWDKRRCLEICKGIKGLNIEYGILARADRLIDEEIVKALSESGCKYVDIGVESFNQKVLDYVKKDLKVETIYKALDLLNKYGISPKLNIMFGTAPTETKEILNSYIEKTLKLPVNYCMYSIATPFPGTEFEKVAKQKKWIKKEGDIYKDLDPAKKSLINYPGLSGETLEKAVHRANRNFYLRPKIIFNQFFRINSVSGFFDTLKGAMRIFSKK